MDKTQKGPKPIIITMDDKGKERKWGPLSRSTAWRAGSFWEDMEGKVKVFIQKGETKSEVTVEERIQCGRKMFWFEEKPVPQPQERQEGNDRTPEQVSGMQVVDPEETETNHAMWLEEKVASLERENEEMKRSSKNGDQNRASRKHAETICGAPKSARFGYDADLRKRPAPERLH